MSTKNKKMLLGSVGVNVLGLVLIFIALPIEKLSVLWFAAFICGFISLVVGLYVSEKKKISYISFFISVAIMISFPLTYIVNIKITDEKYKNKKVETLTIPSEFTPIQQGAIYDMPDEKAEESVVYFTDGDRKANSEAEKVIISSIINSKNNKKIYYYDLSKMPTREVNYAKRQFASNGTPCVVRIKEGILAEEVNIRNIDRLRKFLKKNV